MKKGNIVITYFYILGLLGFFTISLSFLPIQEVDGRCPNGYHRSPDGDCEKVNKVSNEKNADIDDNDNVDFTKTNKEKNRIDEDKSPLNQIFKSNNDDKSSKKEVKNDETNYKENIELEGKITYVVDGDTLDINDIRIRLSLVDTPERGEDGYKETKNFVKELCLNKKGEVDIDDGQRRGDRYGRDIGIVYCDGINLNAALMENNLARIYLEYCDISEFSNEEWAKLYC